MSKSKKRRRFTGLIILALFVVLFTCAGFLLLQGINYIEDYNEALDPGNHEEIEFVVSKGESYKTVGQRLEEEGVIADADIFVYKTKLKEYGPKYQAGTFYLSPSMTMEQIMKALQNAKVEVVKFTIPEGYTIMQTAESLEKQGVCRAEDFLIALEEYEPEYWFLKDLEPAVENPQGTVSAAANKYEGFLFPDTYEVRKTARVQAVLDLMFKRFDQLFTEDMKTQMKSRNLTVKEVVTMASLIERECRVDEERPKIASVIYNRLAKGQNLELDCAIQYILGNPKEGLLYSDLEVESPYNIYKHPGLTPGPIASPGIASIKAVLEPADTNYYYYVLKTQSSIEHNFAETYDQFLVFKKQYKNSK